jgi:hypothetical protein
VPSLTISIEHKDSYELATELVLALQESKALVKPVSGAQTNNFRTTLDLPGIQPEERDRIMREASDWANLKGLKSIPIVAKEGSEATELTFR